MKATSLARPAQATSASPPARSPAARHAHPGNPAPLRRLAPMVRRACAGCEEEAKQILRKSDAPANAGDAANRSVEQRLASPGAPLDSGLRDYFEPQFGADFSAVRINRGALGGESARTVGALAYAVDDDVVFAAGQYAPESQSGRALIAHELAHVVQQDSGTPAALYRRVGGVTCTAGSNGAPADPRKALDDADTIAIRLATQVSTGRADDATAVRRGIPAAPSVTLTAFRAHFGFPPAQGGG